jgi:hypothetical protein
MGVLCTFCLGQAVVPGSNTVLSPTGSEVRDAQLNVAYPHAKTSERVIESPGGAIFSSSYFTNNGTSFCGITFSK